MGSGKDTVIHLMDLPETYTILSADDLGHELLKDPEIIKEILRVFPNCLEKGLINRKHLANIVFPKRVNELNRIMHPALIKAIKEQLKENTIINAALLEELHLKPLSDKVVFVDAPDQTIIDRLKRFPKQDTKTRLSVQKPVDWYKAQADYTLENNGSLEDLTEKVNTLCRDLF